MRPTLRSAPAPAMPPTMVENTSDAIIDLIRLMKMSRKKYTAFPQSGRSQPISPPTTNPIMICTVKEGRYHRRRSDREGVELIEHRVYQKARGGSSSPLLDPPRAF